MLVASYGYRYLVVLKKPTAAELFKGIMKEWTEKSLKLWSEKDSTGLVGMSRKLLSTMLLLRGGWHKSILFFST